MDHCQRRAQADAHPHTGRLSFERGHFLKGIAPGAGCCKEKCFDIKKPSGALGCIILPGFTQRENACG